MDEPRFTILAIDDDPTQLELLNTYFEEIEFPAVEYLTAGGVEEGLDRLHSSTIDLVLTDHRLPDGDGFEVLQKSKAFNPLIKVVIMTAFESVEDAVSIFKHGGDDYLVKPTKREEIEHLVIRLFEQYSIERENREVDEEIEAQFDYMPLVYRSEAMQRVLNLIARSAYSDATVLITGESGTGKELLARLIHRTSARKEEAFVTVNIAALPEGLMESELFGFVKGAFTGAEQSRMGRFEEADGGTIFIDEVGEIPPSIQVKLLRAIQFGHIQRIGENTTRNLDVRIIAATNRDIEGMVEENTFRPDLYWRLNVVRIDVPPLRSRKEDITELTHHFIEKFNRKNRRSIQAISKEALDRLMRHSFPGNIRELENIIERAVIMTRSAQLTRSDLSLDAGEDAAGTVETAAAGELSPEPNSAAGYDEKLHAFESRLIEEALAKAEGNQSEAARLLQISERRLRSRMKILGLRRSESSAPPQAAKHRGNDPQGE